jgi:hypothetical protein
MLENMLAANVGAKSSRYSQSLPSSALIFIVSILSVFLSAACAHIELQPKDPQLLALEQFARGVALHLMNTDPKTYEGYQHTLTQEITPGVLNKLKERGTCPKSEADIKANLATMTNAKRGCLVEIESSSFPERATSAGFVPVEVKGKVTNQVGDSQEKPSAFDLILLIGTNKNTQKPVVTSIQFK